MVVSSDQLAATEDQLFTVGVAIVKEAARVAGIASLPDPLNDGDDSIWQTWQQGFSRTLFNDATGFTNNVNQYEIDSKSMRKIETGESLVLIGTNAHATAGLTVSIGLRFLFKLH
jgi:hypothetical protein